jgi:hypothetical protein
MLTEGRALSYHHVIKYSSFRFSQNLPSDTHHSPRIFFQNNAKTHQREGEPLPLSHLRVVAHDLIVPINKFAATPLHALHFAADKSQLLPQSSSSASTASTVLRTAAYRPKSHIASIKNGRDHPRPVSQHLVPRCFWRARFCSHKYFFQNTIPLVCPCEQKEVLSPVYPAARCPAHADLEPARVVPPGTSPEHHSDCDKRHEKSSKHYHNLHRRFGPRLPSAARPRPWCRGSCRFNRGRWPHPARRSNTPR